MASHGETQSAKHENTLRIVYSTNSNTQLTSYCETQLVKHEKTPTVELFVIPNTKIKLK